MNGSDGQTVGRPIDVWHLQAKLEGGGRKGKRQISKSKSELRWRKMVGRGIVILDIIANGKSMFSFFMNPERIQC